MARKSLIAKCKRIQLRAERQKKAGVKVTHSSKLYNRCFISGRPRGYLGWFGISRIDFREMANRWELPGVRKSSW